MLRSSALVLSTLTALSLLVASGCAHGLNFPEDDQGSLPLGGSTTTVGSSGVGGGKSTGATTTATTAATTVSTVASVTSVGSGPSTSVTTGGGTCDASGDCGTCGNCAVGGQCQAAITACNNDQNCNALVGCLSNCADQTCADGCATQYPGGQAGYTAVVTCVVCDACPVSCNAMAMGTCP